MRAAAASAQGSESTRSPRATDAGTAILVLGPTAPVSSAFFRALRDSWSGRGSRAHRCAGRQDLPARSSHEVRCKRICVGVRYHHIYVADAPSIVVPVVVQDEDGRVCGSEGRLASALDDLVAGCMIGRGAEVAGGWRGEGAVGAEDVVVVACADGDEGMVPVMTLGRRGTRMSRSAPSSRRGCAETSPRAMRVPPASIRR